MIYSANGVSRINFNYTATSIKPNTETPTEMEVRKVFLTLTYQVLILTEDAFNSTGYTEGDTKVLCCDSKAVQVCFGFYGFIFREVSVQIKVIFFSLRIRLMNTRLNQFLSR